MEQPFKITFSTDAMAEVLQVDASDDLSEIRHVLGIPDQRPTLVVVGGASKLSQDDLARVQQLFYQVLAPLAQQWQAVVVDGGTDAGVMRLMGRARTEITADFPLIGIVPEGLAILPDQDVQSQNGADLEPNHTHFVLVPGSAWGDEAPWIANVASTIAGSAPSVTVLVNGGEVTWKDASQSVEANRNIIVIAGSGRTADVIAMALNGKVTDSRAAELVSSGLIQAIDLEGGSKILEETVNAIFACNPNPIV